MMNNWWMNVVLFCIIVLYSPPFLGVFFVFCLFKYFWFAFLVLPPLCNNDNCILMEFK